MTKLVFFLLCISLATDCCFSKKNPRPSSQPSSSPTPSSEQCNAEYVLKGPLVGPPGRDGRDGSPGLPGPSGPPGPGGVNFSDLREMVRLMVKEEMKNLSNNEPLKVVVEYDKLCSITDPSNNKSSNAINSLKPLSRLTSPKSGPPIANTSRKGPCAQGFTKDDAGISCREIFNCNPFLSSGYYWTRTYHKVFHHVYCYMEDNLSGLRGMTRVALLNMTDSLGRCPPSLTMTTQAGKRMCIGSVSGSQYSSVFYDVFNISYNYVLGRAVGYVYYGPQAFYSSHTIDSAYVSGLSITYRVKTTRNHIWTYAAGYRKYPHHSYNCPCAANSGNDPPSFVGNNFYCESPTYSSPSGRWYTSNPLWDGRGCSSRCCTKRQPWFWTILPDTTNSNIEVRWMDIQGHSRAIVGVELLELYVY